MGAGVSTLDLVDHQFTLFTGDQRWCAVAASASAALGISVAVHCIADDQWPARTGLESGGALLVRPDDVIGWRAEELSDGAESRLRQAFSTVLYR